ncbi:hypothetical protein B0H34DRAFT_819578 [Crassisporium funariophilum]|nr:hypothetical protein B0H34DRAFT_819578 [Crassisporium funariophilum]
MSYGLSTGDKQAPSNIAQSATFSGATRRSAEPENPVRAHESISANNWGPNIAGQVISSNLIQSLDVIVKRFSLDESASDSDKDVALEEYLSAITNYSHMRQNLSGRSGVDPERDNDHLSRELAEQIGSSKRSSRVGRYPRSAMSKDKEEADTSSNESDRSRGPSSKKWRLYKEDMPWHKQELIARQSQQIQVVKPPKSPSGPLDLILHMSNTPSNLHNPPLQVFQDLNGITSSGEQQLTLTMSSHPCTTCHLLKRTLDVWDQLKSVWDIPNLLEESAQTRIGHPSIITIELGVSHGGYLKNIILECLDPCNGSAHHDHKEWRVVSRTQFVITTPSDNRQQRRTREASRRLNENRDESPSRRRTPAPRPETPTPQPGAVERTRAASRRSRREIRENDLQNSPRRQRTSTTQDENRANMSGATGSQERVIHANRLPLAPIPNCLLPSPPSTQMALGANQQLISPRPQIQLPPSKRAAAQQRRQQQARRGERALQAVQVPSQSLAQHSAVLPTPPTTQEAPSTQDQQDHARRPRVRPPPRVTASTPVSRTGRTLNARVLNARAASARQRRSPQPSEHEHEQVVNEVVNPVRPVTSQHASFSLRNNDNAPSHVHRNVEDNKDAHANALEEPAVHSGRGGGTNISQNNDLQANDLPDPSEYDSEDEEGEGRAAVPAVKNIVVAVVVAKIFFGRVHLPALEAPPEVLHSFFYSR